MSTGRRNLEDPKLDQVRLNWQQHIDLAIDVARALVFPHQECFLFVLHHDIKASNILLDKDSQDG